MNTAAVSLVALLIVGVCTLFAISPCRPSAPEQAGQQDDGTPNPLLSGHRFGR